MAMQLPKGGIGWEKIKKRGLGGGREHCVSQRGHKGLGLGMKVVKYFIRSPAADQFHQFNRDFALE
jgi:hypothetical protein